MEESIKDAVSLILSVLSLITSVAVVVRLVVKTESSVDVLKEQMKDVTALSRSTHDHLHGPVHVDLEGQKAKTERLIEDIKGLATQERVDSLIREVIMSIKHLETKVVLQLQLDRATSKKEED